MSIKTSTSGKHTLLITSCDGQTGCYVAKELIGGGYEDSVERVLLACMHTEKNVHSLESEASGKLKVDSITVDPRSSTPEQLADKLKGVTGLCIIPPTSADRIDVAWKWIAAGQLANVQSAVLVSWAGAELAPSDGIIAKFQGLERDFLQQCTIPNRLVMRAGFYAQNLQLYSKQIIKEQHLPAPTGDAKWAPLDLRMLAKAVATALSSDAAMGKNQNQVLTLTGPKALSGSDMAECIGKATDKPCEFRNVSSGEAEKLIRTASKNLDDTEVKALLESYDLIRQGKMNFTTTDIQKVLGDQTQLMSFADTIKLDLPILQDLANRG